MRTACQLLFQVVILIAVIIIYGTGIDYGSDYSPRSRANSYKAGNDDVFSLFHAETD